MKIVNMNSITKPWTVWNKTYCQDINNKITSLYDYIIWNYPEYLIFNSPTKLYKTSIFEPYKSLSDAEVESRLDNHPYEYIVTMIVKPANAQTTKNQKYSLFIPTRLNYHQGFYNQSNDGDGVLCAKIADEVFMSLSVDENEDTQAFIKNADSTYSIYGAKYTTNSSYDDYNQCYYWDGTTWQYTSSTTDLEDAIMCLYIYEQEYELKLNFLSGYVCICNKQVTGKASENNLDRFNLNSYLIAPMGNGGYYDMYWNSSIFETNFKANDFNNFSNKITINLATNCRYINPAPTTTLNSYNTLVIDNIVEDTLQLTDAHNNLWTGQQDLVGYMITIDGEQIFADVQYSTYMSVQNNRNIHHFSVKASDVTLKEIKPQLQLY